MSELYPTISSPGTVAAPGVPSDKWRQQARDLFQIARAGSSAFDPGEEFVPNYKDPRYEGPYGDLSIRLWVEFVNQARACGERRYEELAASLSVASGFNVIGKILSFAPAAYTEYCMKNDQPLDLSQLEEILRRSAKSIITLFADRDISSNVTLETNFGLRGFLPEYDEIPFIIESDTEGELSFLPAPNSLNKTKLDIYRWKREKDESARCPAYPNVLNMIWDRAVDACVNEQELFPNSLGLKV